MDYQEDDYLMLSGIQHFAFCRRQWALIHIEQQWAENVHTVTGELFHKKAHDKFSFEKRKDVLITRSLPIYSHAMGVSGFCDIVEFHESKEGISIHGRDGYYYIYPIEYKKGSPKNIDADILQLTAQAMCLEEMFSATIEQGAVFYGETRRREEVTFTPELRDKVQAMFSEMHQHFERRYTPKVKWSKSCNACSLKDICLPKLGKAVSVKQYIDKNIQEGTE